MAAATFEEAQMTWLVRNPSFGLAAAPDWELPEEDEVLQSYQQTKSINMKHGCSD